MPEVSFFDAERSVMTAVIVHILHSDVNRLIVFMLHGFEILLNIGSVKIVIQVEVGRFVWHNKAIIFLIRVIVFLLVVESKRAAGSLATLGTAAHCWSFTKWRA